MYIYRNRKKDEEIDNTILKIYIDGLACLGQDCSISIANALEKLQSCTEPSNVAKCM